MLTVDWKTLKNVAQLRAWIV